MITPAPASISQHELEERRATLSDLNAEMRPCRACALANGRTQVVPGEGPVDAEIIFIGEAPGYYEDQQGHPFVGAAGQFLESLLAGIGLKRSDVFIANVIKCRPPGNRDPLPEEISACSNWLNRQLGIVRPKLIVTLGRYSLARFLPGTPIGRVHGQGRKLGSLWVVPMYHPAAALHQGGLRKTIEDDFRKIPEYVALAEREFQATMTPVAAAATAPEASQIPLL